MEGVPQAASPLLTIPPSYRFFDTRHQHHYKVYNLCCEPGRRYPASTFHGWLRALRCRSVVFCHSLVQFADGVTNHHRPPQLLVCVPSLTMVYQRSNFCKPWDCIQWQIFCCTHF